MAARAVVAVRTVLAARTIVATRTIVAARTVVAAMSSGSENCWQQGLLWQQVEVKLM